MKNALSYLVPLLFLVSACGSDLFNNEVEKPYIDRYVIAWQWIVQQSGQVCVLVTYDDEVGTQELLCGAQVKFVVHGDEVCVVLEHDGVTEEIECGQFEIDVQSNQTCVYFRTGNDRDLLFCQPVSTQIIRDTITLIEYVRDTIVLPGSTDTVFVDRPVYNNCQIPIDFTHFSYDIDRKKLHVDMRMRAGECECEDQLRYYIRPINPAQVEVTWQEIPSTWSQTNEYEVRGDMCNQWISFETRVWDLDVYECVEIGVRTRNGKQLYRMIYTVSP